MRKKILRQVFLLFLLSGIVNACMNESDFFSLGEGLPPKVSEAKAWYESQVQEGFIPWKPATGGKENVLIPDWKKAFSNEDSLYQVTEVHLDGDEKFCMVSSECQEKYRETGDWRYMASDLRLVVRTNKETGQKDGFIMVVYPDLQYLEKHKDNPLKDISYLKRDENFGGVIYYHDMNGEFVNGWSYTDGNICALYPNEDMMPDGPQLRDYICTQVCETITNYVYHYFNGDLVGISNQGSTTTCWYINCYETGGSSGGGYGGDSGSGGGGGGSSSGGSSSPPVVTYIKSDYAQIAAKVNEVMPDIFKLLQGKNMDISKYKFRVGEHCTVNARVLDGYIEICASFLNWNIYDQSSIIWHEVYHMLNDKPWSSTVRPLYSPIKLNPPAWAESYIRNNIVGNFGTPSALEIIYQEEITVSSIKDPQFYKNEIAAYQGERSEMPNCSSEYKAQGDYQMWRYQQLLEIANKYYNY